MASDFFDTVPPNIQTELSQRYDELSRLEKEQVQMGTTVPQLFGTLGKYIANPSSVSVETYKRMLDTDEQIGSGVDFMNLAMIARFGDYKHPSTEITAFVRQVLSSMDGSWHRNLDEMFSAEWAGFSATEQVWDYKNDFSGMPAYVPTKLVTYPPLTVVFAVDQHGDLLPDGIFQYQRYHNTFSGNFGRSGGDLDGFRPDLYASIGDLPYPIRVSADLSFLTLKMPRHKMIHLTSSVTGNFANPYGRSILRRGFKNWILKDAFLKMWLIAADRKGTPLVVGYADPNATVLEADPRTGVVAGRADQSMANIFKTIHGSSFIVLPGKKGDVYDVEAIQVNGDTNVFKEGVEYFNAALMRTLLIPPLCMGAGDGAGSYALGQEHHKIFGKSVDGKSKGYKQGILDQFIKKVIGYNFPKSSWERDGMGDFLLEEYDPENMEKLGNIYQVLTTTGYMSAESQSDMDFVRQKMGLPKGMAQMPMAMPATTDSPLDLLPDDLGI
jgi:hypothetical protein